MKKIFTWMVLLVVAAVAFGAVQDTALVTPFRNWTVLGTINGTAGAADSALGATERSYTSAIALTNVAYWNIPYGANAVQLRFRSATNNSDFVCDIWAAKDGDDNLQRICTVTMITGQQTAQGAIGYWIDTITITNEAWYSSVKVNQPGTDLMATMSFDMCGYRTIVIQAYGTCDENLVVCGSGY